MYVIHLYIFQLPKAEFIKTNFVDMTRNQNGKYARKYDAVQKTEAHRADAVHIQRGNVFNMKIRIRESVCVCGGESHRFQKCATNAHTQIRIRHMRNTSHTPYSFQTNTLTSLPVSFDSFV